MHDVMYMYAMVSESRVLVRYTTIYISVFTALFLIKFFCGLEAIPYANTEVNTQSFQTSSNLLVQKVLICKLPNFWDTFA